VTESWKNLHFTNNPIAASLKAGAKHAESIGLLKPVNLAGIYDLKPLNEVLSAAGKETVKTT
jgi:NitT/TauT family transport system substrate-binding protein